VLAEGEKVFSFSRFLAAGWVFALDLRTSFLALPVLVWARH
jgi:hypothetical protein